ncbi:MAG: hypothetical protein IPP23_12305 [Sphingomonadales bacterium]|nr:hypothetical protein [Sphingomonadales bacterium]
MATAKKPAAAAAKTTKAKAAPAKAAKPKAAASAAKNSVAKAKPSPGKVETEVKATVKDDFANFKDKAADGARAAADRGKERAADALGGIGKILRESADTIDEKLAANMANMPVRQPMLLMALLARSMPRMSTILSKMLASLSAKARRLRSVRQRRSASSLHA